LCALERVSRDKETGFWSVDVLIDFPRRTIGDVCVSQSLFVALKRHQHQHRKFIAF